MSSVYSLITKINLTEKSIFSL